MYNFFMLFHVYYLVEQTYNALKKIPCNTDLTHIIHLISFLLMLNPPKALKNLFSYHFLMGLLPDTANEVVKNFFINLISPTDSFFNYDETLSNFIWRYCDQVGFFPELSMMALHPGRELEMDKFDVNFKNFDLNKIISEVSKYQPTIRAKRLSFFTPEYFTNNTKGYAPEIESLSAQNGLDLFDIDLIKGFFRLEIKKKIATNLSSLEHIPNTFKRSFTKAEKSTHGGTLYNIKTSHNQQSSTKMPAIENKKPYEIKPIENRNSINRSAFKLPNSKNSPLTGSPALNPKKNSPLNDRLSIKVLTPTKNSPFEINLDSLKLYPFPPLLTRTLEKEIELKKLELSPKIIKESENYCYSTLEIFYELTSAAILSYTSSKFSDQFNLICKDTLLFWQSYISSYNAKAIESLLKIYFGKLYYFGRNECSITNSCYHAGQTINLILKYILTVPSLSKFRKDVFQLCIEQLPLLMKSLKVMHQDGVGRGVKSIGCFKYEMASTFIYLLLIDDTGDLINFKDLPETLFQIIEIWFFEDYKNNLLQCIFLELFEKIMTKGKEFTKISVCFRLGAVGLINDIVQRLYKNSIKISFKNVEQLNVFLKKLTKIIKDQTKPNSNLEKMLKNSLMWESTLSCYHISKFNGMIKVQSVSRIATLQKKLISEKAMDYIETTRSTEHDISDIADPYSSGNLPSLKQKKHYISQMAFSNENNSINFGNQFYLFNKKILNKINKNLLIAINCNDLLLFPILKKIKLPNSCFICFSEHHLQILKNFNERKNQKKRNKKFMIQQ